MGIDEIEMPRLTKTAVFQTQNLRRQRIASGRRLICDAGGFQPPARPLRALLLYVIVALLGMLPVGVPAAHPADGSSARRQSSEEIPLSLTTQGANGEMIPVDGIVCDNLRETREDQKDCLSIDLPAPYSEYETDGFLTAPDGAKTDLRGNNNVGVLAAQTGRLIYYPPDEFNSTQEPEDLREVDGPATRIVLLHIRVRSPGGEWRDLPPKPIVLARPPIVLIHGVNTGPDCWAPFAKRVAALRGAGSRPIEFPLTTVDHYAPANYEGVNFGDRSRFPDGLYAGCGPVEFAAALLARRLKTVLEDVREATPIPFYEAGVDEEGRAAFAYHFPEDPNGKPPRLAIRRVDIVAYSYGGVIARWYLASDAVAQGAPTSWYRGDYALTDPGGAPLNLRRQTPYRGDVRKLITLGSMWRGVTLSNYVNEVRFSDPDDPDSLARAPVRIPQWMPRSMSRKIAPRRTAGSMIDAIDTFLRVRTPATEVMAVESPWLRVLIYGTPTPNARSQARPFRDDVAYGSVAGDNSRYLNFGPLHGLSLPGVTLYFQQPPRFAFIGLERRGGAGGTFAPMIGGPGDYSDGLVPVWSALIPGSAPGASLVVHASHGSYYTDREALKYVSRWLNNALLPTGETLCSQWDTPLVSAGGRRCWRFQPDRMAPIPESELYACVNGIGRLAPDALHASRSIRLSKSEEGSVTVRWDGPVGAHLDRVQIFERPQAAEGVKEERPKRIAVVKAAGETPHPTVVLPPLRSDRAYYILAEAVLDNRPDPPIRLRSDRIPVHVGQHFPPDGRPPISKPPAPIR